jgi:hypothetical protein
MNRRFIFGLGTGRCGSMTLANLLSLQDNCLVSHEVGGVPYLPWNLDEKAIANYLKKVSFRREEIVGDIAFYLLPYAKTILERYPDTKFIVLQRDKQETVLSYDKKTKNRNHWMNHDGKKWHHDIWDKCYPKFKANSKLEAIENYYELYYEECKKLNQDSYFWLNTQELNDEVRCHEMLKWAGFEDPKYKIILSNKGV